MKTQLFQNTNSKTAAFLGLMADQALSAQTTDAAGPSARTAGGDVWNWFDLPRFGLLSAFKSRSALFLL